MSEETDHESKTEEPTEKRIADALGKGNVPLAREVTLLGSITASFAALALLGTWATTRLMEVLISALGGAGTLRIDDREGAAVHLVALFGGIGLPLLPLMAIIAAGSVLASLLQNVPSMAEDRITPKSSRISPLAGWTRLFGREGLVEFAKSVIKIAAVSALLWALFRRDLQRFASLLASEPSLLPSLLHDLANGVFLPMIALALLLAVADLSWSRFRWRRDLRMTRQEVKDEIKEAEGDPFIKGRIRVSVVR